VAHFALLTEFQGETAKRGEGGRSASLGFIIHLGLVLAAISDNMLEPGIKYDTGI